MDYLHPDRLDRPIPVFVVTEGLVYVAVPKAGMTSIKIALAEFMGHPEPNWDREVPGDGDLIHEWWTPHLAFDAEGLRHALEHRWGGWHRFTVVRDPVERFLSIYNGRFHAKEPDINVFVEDVLPRWLEAKQVHEMPQADIVVDPDLYDHIGRTDAMARTGAWLSEITGRVIEVPSANASIHHRTWADLTPENQARVKRFYRRDYELLGEMVSA